MASEHDRRAVLEGIAFGSDAGVSPSDRLRALELLQKIRRQMRPPVARRKRQTGSSLRDLSNEVLERAKDEPLALAPSGPPR